MTIEQFRLEEVWTIEVDLIFKANKENVEVLFKYMIGREKHFTPETAYSLMKKAQAIEP